MDERKEEKWILPPLVQPLEELLTEIHGIARGGLDEQNQGEQEEVKGLKFISGKLIKLFEKNRKLKYSYISKVLIDNFSSESNDSRNIKRRVYDAINVMVAAGLFIKNGDMLEKQQNPDYRNNVQNLKSEIATQHKQKQIAISYKHSLLKRMVKRKQKMQELFQRNKKMKSQKIQPEPIFNPIFINPKEGTKKMTLNSKEGETLCKIELGKSVRGKPKSKSPTQIYQQMECLQYLP